MRNVTVAAIQMQCDKDVEPEYPGAERLVRQDGCANYSLTELFERPYFCQEHWYDFYQYASLLQKIRLFPAF